ncbi:uncharacterized protein At4g26485-like [Nicotiana tomentosiformis]|uniref:uncharacterized protein At4g26485-like n=1 Tax=Nicotiana tomentosiformis TaxID=4098 RepID=UPI00051BFCDF|nr:uncharacterized protein At4g26485-like isoform X1 [Nicotiana tomentosiformis]
MAEDPRVISEDEEEEEEKRIQHYSSFHEILLVGEGDFSFSLCLALAFGSASNIVASSLQSHDEVIKMYKNGKLNLEKLKSLEGTVLHGVDATKMQLHPDLANRKFDRLIFNFPHAGFHGSENNNRLIHLHRNLVVKFFGSARKRLRPDGEVHVTHKTTHPFCCWDLAVLASAQSLTCIASADFNIKNYPGYNNKRGGGERCDESFPLGECCTFKFIFDPSHKNMQRTKQKKHKSSKSSPIYSFQQQLSWIDSSRNSPTYVNDINGFPSHAGLLERHDPRSECFRIFKEYFSYIQQTFGRKDIDVEVEVRQALHRGSLMYSSEDYLEILEELHFWSWSRISRLQQKLQNLDRRLYELQDVGYYL